jgi:PAS domain S-box-containing protein
VPSYDGSVTAGAYKPETLEAELAALRERIAELERNRELLNAIANYAPSFLCIVDEEGRVRDRATNIAFEDALGYAPDETGGVVFWARYVHTDDAAEVERAIAEVVAGGTPQERDGRWMTRGGEVINVAWSCTPLPAIATRRLFLICATDITERTRQAEELRKSRARIVAAGDEARKRLERNLHDGAQQHLIALLLALRGLRDQAKDRATAESLTGAVDELEQAVDELLELSRGIHPVGLERGLAGAVEQLAKRAHIAVSVEVSPDRYAEPVEAAAYYVVSEALANVAKHAEATKTSVRIADDGEQLLVEVVDDGRGGADPALGSGLRGLADRVAALDGTFSVGTPAAGGTHVRAEIPLA